MYKHLILTVSIFFFSFAVQGADLPQTQHVGRTTMIVKVSRSKPQKMSSVKYVKASPAKGKLVKAKGYQSTAELVNFLLGFETRTQIARMK